METIKKVSLIENSTGDVRLTKEARAAQPVVPLDLGLSEEALCAKRNVTKLRSTSVRIHPPHLAELLRPGMPKLKKIPYDNIADQSAHATYGRRP